MTISTIADDAMIVTLHVRDLRAIICVAVVEALTAKGHHDLLDLKQVAERYKVGREAIIAAAKRGEIALSQGPRRKFLVRANEVERWLTERKYVPPDRTVPVDLEEWDRQVAASLERAVAEGRLRRMSPREIEEARARRKQEAAARKRAREVARDGIKKK
jgi:hypothetical protein